MSDQWKVQWILHQHRATVDPPYSRAIRRAKRLYGFTCYMFYFPWTCNSWRKCWYCLFSYKWGSRIWWVNRQSFSLPLIKHQLVYLCNLPIDQSIFPEELKLANVCPLFKSGDSMCFSNYRPVSLLFVVSKVFEKVMYSRILKFL